MVFLRPVLNFKIYCFASSFLAVNEESLGFGLLDEGQLEDVSLGNCEELHRPNNRLINLGR